MNNESGLLFDYSKTPLEIGGILLIKTGGEVVQNQRQTAKALPKSSINTVQTVNTTPAAIDPSKTANSVTDNIKECPIYFEKFTPKRSDAVYCSVRCRVAHYRQKAGVS
jgi:hypothetical protein